jgi:hypothetical protein
MPHGLATAASQDAAASFADGQPERGAVLGAKGAASLASSIARIAALLSGSLK